MTCSRSDDDRLRYVAELMDEHEAVRFERHILKCPECRKAVEALAAEERLLKAVMKEVGRRGDVVSSVMRRIVVRKPRLWRWVAAAAAAVVLLLAALIPWTHTTPLHVAKHTITDTLALPSPEIPSPIDAVVDTELEKAAEEEGVD